MTTPTPPDAVREARFDVLSASGRHSVRLRSWRATQRAIRLALHHPEELPWRVVNHESGETVFSIPTTTERGE